MPLNEEIIEIKKRLEEHERRISKLEGLPQGKSAVAKKSSVKEFILSKKVKDEVQKTLAIGYYLENYEGLTSFNVKDLEGGFRKAKEQIPGNINDKVNLNIAKGHMMDAKEKKDKLKAWVLTNSGEKFVQNDFQKD